MNIIGISSHYHDSACCLIIDGKLVSAVEEERLSRLKHDNRVPINAFNYCLKENNLTITDIDCIAFYENPYKKLNRQLWSAFSDISSKKRLNETILKLDPTKVMRDIRDVLGYGREIKFYDHHQSHAASSYFFSDFEESAFMTVDGVGEWATASFGFASADSIKISHSINYPNSVGLLYSTITSFLGFKVNDAEYKVMGLAPYGDPVYHELMLKLLECCSLKNFSLNHEFFDFSNPNRMYTEKLVELFGFEPRTPESKLEKKHFDLARSLQTLLEEILLGFVQDLYKLHPSKNLCMAGGVALNCVANGRIKREGPFENLFVQPAAGDSGAALGAAALAYSELSGKKYNQKLINVYLGPSYSNDDIAELLKGTPIKYKTDNTKDMIMTSVERLSSGKVIGWFQGRLEFGPRALGSRSILADPRGPDMRDRINALVKKRESFRPFAPSVLFEKVCEHFDLDHESPYMLETCNVCSPLDLPAITHVDNSARVQTVTKKCNGLYYTLIKEFEAKTGCPLLLNTSFNLRSEPIVCDPLDAIVCFIRSKLDVLVLGDFLIDREDFPIEWFEWYHRSSVKSCSAIQHDVYTFI